MRKTILTIFLGILACLGFSQEHWNLQMRQDFQKADFAFYQGNYVSAHDLLRGIYEVDSTNSVVLYEYGTSIIQLNKDKSLAKSVLKKAVDSGENEAQFWYAKSLHLTGEFKKAIAYFSSYQELNIREINNDEIEREIQICKNAIEAYKKPVDIRVSNLGNIINSEAKEYVPLITGDGREMYFTSRRKNDLHDKTDQNNEYYEDIYWATCKEGSWMNVKPLCEEINTKSHDATVALSGDGKTMIIYRTHRNLTGGDLYITKKLNESWSKPKKLNRNINSDYQEASACLSQDGQTMYFSSNRPGGEGGKDIYVVRRLPTGDWSRAVNLGPIINSPMDEDAPHINKNGTTLYFASNGHKTIGGFDIFKSDLDDEFVSEPKNIGYPVNTVDDEIYLTLDDSELKGYYASDKGNGYGALDIYELEFIYREKRNLVAFGAVMNQNQEALVATVTVFDKDQKKLQGIYNTHPETGKFMLALHPKTQYQVLIEAKGHRIMMTDLFIDEFENGIAEYQLEPYNLTIK